MSLLASKMRLLRMTKALLNGWEQTRVHWRDERGSTFHDQYIRQLLPSVNAATEAIDKLDKLLAKIRHDCE